MKRNLLITARADITVNTCIAPGIYNIVGNFTGLPINYYGMLFVSGNQTSVQQVYKPDGYKSLYWRYSSDVKSKPLSGVSWTVMVSA